MPAESSSGEMGSPGMSKSSSLPALGGSPSGSSDWSPGGGVAKARPGLSAHEKERILAMVQDGLEKMDGDQLMDSYSCFRSVTDALKTAIEKPMRKRHAAARRERAQQQGGPGYQHIVGGLVSKVIK